MEISESAKEIVEAIKDCIGHEQKRLPIGLHEPDFDSDVAKKYLCKCIDSNWVSTTGEWIKTFEQEVKDYTGAKYAISISNGTNALKLALYTCGVDRDNEVLTSPISFVATANAISHLGAVPNFVDIEKDTLGIDPIKLDQYIEKIQTKKDDGLYNKYTGRKITAVVPIHVFGIPCKIKQICEIACKWNLPVIEDAAEALGSY